MRESINIKVAHKPKSGLTISTSAKICSETKISYFSLGNGTSITPEMYSSPVIYIGMGGNGFFNINNNPQDKELHEGDMLIVLKDTLCGVKTQNGLVYTEIIPKTDIVMNNNIKAGEIINLAQLLPYEADSIVNMDISSNETMKYVLMSFDAGTSLSPHRAPGDALVFALEGNAIISYEGNEYNITAGETFKFDKNGLHSVKAISIFKMALLIVLK